MSKTSVEVPGIGTVYITKKRGQRSMRLRVDTKGQVQVSMPWVVPRNTALDFVLSKRPWIQEQQAGYSFSPYNGMLFGKTLRLIIMQRSSSVRTKQIGKDVIVYFDRDYDPSNETQLEKIKKAMMRALRTEAEKVLLPRLKEFALEYGFSYKSAGVKQVVGRWGSCDSTAHISLSLYLIQLPIELIDYVLIHELAHTVHMNHSPAFWSLVEKFMPEYKQIKKQMRGMQPRIYDAKTFMA
jgi:predicted metal-dependent hydrolase